MIVIFDGPQLAGKTTLLKEVCRKKPGLVIKFPFTQVVKDFSLTNVDTLKGLQLGKDFGMFEVLANLENLKGNVYLDRGVLSSAYYSLTQKRMSILEVSTFISRIKEKLLNSQNMIKLVWVHPIGQREITRDKRDGFDGLDSIEPETLAESFLCQKAEDEFGDRFIAFENDFEVPLKETVEGLIKKLKL